MSVEEIPVDFVLDLGSDVGLAIKVEDAVIDIEL